MQEFSAAVTTTALENNQPSASETEAANILTCIKSGEALASASGVGNLKESAISTTYSNETNAELSSLQTIEQRQHSNGLFPK